MMNLKYYLRGLGIGIVVTALIMGIIAGNSGKEPSESEIKRRAKELGMVEEGAVLADMETGEEKDSGEEPIAESVQEPVSEPEAEPSAESALAAETEQQEELDEEPVSEQQEEPVTEPTAEPTEEPTATQTPEPTAEPEEAPSITPVMEDVTVTVHSGEGSYTVAKRLQEAGVIFSASDFDHYLCEHGYDKQIRVGSWVIPSGADPEQIAGILTGRG